MTQPGGGSQVTYNGHALYYYVGDHGPGQTTGQGLNQFGALWYVLGPRRQRRHLLPHHTRARQRGRLVQLRILSANFTAATAPSPQLQAGARRG